MMSLFSKIFGVFKKKEPKLTKEQIKELTNTIIHKNENALNQLGDALNKLGDEMDYDGMGNYGRFPPIIGDDYPTYEQVIKEYHESQNSK